MRLASGVKAPRSRQSVPVGRDRRGEARPHLAKVSQFLWV